jgi:ABC-type branched-subunit amino acid transport system ATPase component
MTTDVNAALNGARPAILEAQNLTKVFGGLRAVSKFEVTIRQG